MLYGYFYRRLFRDSLSMTGMWKKSSNCEEMQVISPVASHSGVQEECHSRVQDPPQPGPGIENYGTKITAISGWEEQEDSGLDMSSPC